METTTTFVLGMSFAVIIILSIVAVIGFVKANKNETQLKEIRQSLELYISEVNRSLATSINDVNLETNHRITTETSNLYSHIDSRLDKLETKLTRHPFANGGFGVPNTGTITTGPNVSISGTNKFKNN